MAQYKKGDVVLITGVDMYGFHGREEHPGPEHIGLTAEVIDSHESDCRMLPEDPPEVFEFVRVLTYGVNPVYLEMVEFEITKNTVST